MLSTTHDKARATISFYLKHKIPFKYEIQNETITITCKLGSYSTFAKTYTIDEINFIKKVKQHIIKNELNLPYLDATPGKVKYFMYGDALKDGAKIGDMVNIDISSAYWETANAMGLFSDAIYEQGNKIRKQARLAALGSLAKKKRIYEFDGKVQIKHPIKRSEQTEKIWDVICEKVGQVLTDAANACGKDFYFFWIDGIYVKKRAMETVTSVFKQHGYGYKVNEYKEITIDKRFLKLWLTEPEPKVVNAKGTFMPGKTEPDLSKNERLVQKEYKVFPFNRLKS